MQIQMHCVKKRGRQSKRKKKKKKRKYKEKSQKEKEKEESIMRKDEGNKDEWGGQKRERKLCPTFFKLILWKSVKVDSISNRSADQFPQIARLGHTTAKLYSLKSESDMLIFLQ